MPARLWKVFCLMPQLLAGVMLSCLSLTVVHLVRAIVMALTAHQYPPAWGAVMVAVARAAAQRW